MNARAWVGKKPVFENLEELHLERMDSLKELCFGELPSRSLWNLKVLKVSGCPNLGNVLLPSKLLHRLANLENLICKCMPGMEYVFGCEGFEAKGGGLFLPAVLQSKLRVMNLLELDAVRSICNGPAPPTMFQALKSLFIHRCNFLGSLFTFDVAQYLFQVEDLFVESCPNLERVIEASKEIANKKKTVLPKVKNLVLVDLPMLCSSSATIDMECPSLQHLYVKDCPSFSAPVSAFQSKNKVQLNNILGYVILHSTRLNDSSAWNTPNSIFKGIEKKQISMRNELLQNMPDELPELKGMTAGLAVKIPEIVEKIHKISGKMPRSILKQMPELMGNIVPKIMEKSPEIFQSIPRWMVKQMPDILEKIVLEKLPGLMDEMPAFVKMIPELLKHTPELIEMMTKLQVHRMIETGPEIMENFPQMVTESLENLPGLMEEMPVLVKMLPEILKDLKHMPESIEMMTKSMEQEHRLIETRPEIMENFPQIMTESGENMPLDLTDVVSSLKSFFEDFESEINSAQQ